MTILLQKYKIALYAPAWANMGGTGVYTRRLIDGIRDAGISEVFPVGLKKYGFAGKLISEHISIPLMLKHKEFDLIHLPAFAGRVPRGVPYAVTVHDMAFLANPRWFPLLKSVYYRIHFPSVARKASVIIADSDFTVSEIKKYLGLAAERVYLSAETNLTPDTIFRETMGITGDYILSVGTIEPRKNISALLEAWKSVKKLHPEKTLVVAGRWGWGTAKTRKALLNTAGVRWLGSIGHEMLQSAYSGAKLLVYPSLYEGFGLPPLESAASGVPFVTGPAESVGEIFGEIAVARAGKTAPSIARAVLDALETSYSSDDLRNFASRFSGTKLAVNTYKAYGKAFE